MKILCKVWYPVQLTHEEETEIDIPDGQDPADWICEHEQEIIEKCGCEETPPDLSFALDMGYAGVKVK